MDQVYLQGSETVHSAAGIISSAANNMNSAARNFQYSVDQLERILQNFLCEFQAQVDRIVALHTDVK